jgi:hypothetical protein
MLKVIQQNEKKIEDFHLGIVQCMGENNIPTEDGKKKCTGDNKIKSGKMLLTNSMELVVLREQFSSNLLKL